MSRDLTTTPYEQSVKVLQVIWGAMVFSVGVYVAIAWMVETGAAIGDEGRTVVLSLGALSVALFIAQVKINQNLKDEKLFPRILDLGSWGLKPEMADQLQELKVPERGVHLILQAHVIFSIIQVAFHIA